MLGVTRLLCGTVTPGDALRFGRLSGELPPHLLHYSEDKKPVIAWNVTRRCNLHCAHCYTDSFDRDYEGELTTEEAKAVIDDLAAFGAPVILFSGGEPLLRPDLPELVERAQSRGIRSVISTNGTLLIHAVAQELKDLGVSYVGVSIDGPAAGPRPLPGHGRAPSTRRCRGSATARRWACASDCASRSRSSATRIWTTSSTCVEAEDIPRVCFYHLAYAGRGDRIVKYDLSHEETRAAVDLIFERTLDFARRGITKDVLTVDNHTDAVYLYLTVRETRAAARRRGATRCCAGRAATSRASPSGTSTRWATSTPTSSAAATPSATCASAPSARYGRTRASRCWRRCRDRRGRIKGRCARCAYFDICNGNLRARAESFYGDLWAEDPACYLTDAELGIVPETATA